MWLPVTSPSSTGRCPRKRCASSAVSQSPPTDARRATLLGGVRRLAIIYAAVLGGTLLGSALIGLALGASVLRSMSVGLYLAGAVLFLGCFVIGARGPLRGVNRAGETVPLIGARSVRRAKTDERSEAARTSVLLFALGLTLVVLGRVARPRAQDVLTHSQRISGFSH